MKTFKHSGAFGDLIYGLPIMKHFGGGDFYLHLNQMDWVGQYYYGSRPAPFHQGRLTVQDFESIRPLLLAQDYVTGCEILDPKRHEITHNLDRFRQPFVGHPGNYVDIYSSVFRLSPEDAVKVRTTPWLAVEPKVSKPVVINRTQRWTPPSPGPEWQQWKAQGLEDRAIFVGSPDEHRAFASQTGLNIAYQPTENLLELAQYIAGAEEFIGNQSVALSIAIGLGQKFHCELRRDLPKERNECWFPDQPGGNYF